MVRKAIEIFGLYIETILDLPDTLRECMVIDTDSRINREFITEILAIASGDKVFKGAILDFIVKHIRRS